MYGASYSPWAPIRDSTPPFYLEDENIFQKQNWPPWLESSVTAVLRSTTEAEFLTYPKTKKDFPVGIFSKIGRRQ
jgi:hypothetical protein